MDPRERWSAGCDACIEQGRRRARGKRADGFVAVGRMAEGTEVLYCPVCERFLVYDERSGLFQYLAPRAIPDLIVKGGGSVAP